MTKFFQKKLVICQVSLANNIPIIQENYNNFSKFYNNLIFFIICPKNQIKIFKKKLNKKNIFIINEEKIFKFSKFKTLFIKFSKKITYKKKFLKRLNWYYQQILKIVFILNNKICQTNNLILWDADTLILKKIDFFNDNYSINYSNVFEYHRSYFLTSQKLLNIKIPRNYLSSINQFIAINSKENKFIKSKLIGISNQKVNANNISQKIFKSIFLGNINFNHSMFSEYETIGLCKYLKNPNFKQKIIFFLRYKISGKLSNFQKKICILFNCFHVSYEEHNNNKYKKKILSKKQNFFSFIKIFFKQYIKYNGRKIKYLFTYKFN